REGVASALQLLARTALARGDLAAAQRRINETLHLHRQLGQRGGIAAALETHAQLMTAAGDDDAATGAATVAAQLPATIAPPTPPDRSMANIDAAIALAVHHPEL